MSICRKLFNTGVLTGKIFNQAALKGLSNSRLILLGTLHLDIGLGPVIRSFLDMICPGIVSVEISPFSVKFRERYQARWISELEDVLGTFPPAARAHAAVQLLRLQLSMPYEWTSSSSYAQGKGIKCIPIDDSHIARKELPSWKTGLITRQNIKGLIGAERFCLVRYFLEKHGEAQRRLGLWQRPLPEKDFLRWLSEPVWRARERRLASRLLELVYSQAGPVVHVGGWMHLKSGKAGRGTMADMLGKLRPSKVLVSRDKNGTPMLKILD